MGKTPENEYYNYNKFKILFKPQKYMKMNGMNFYISHNILKCKWIVYKETEPGLEPILTFKSHPYIDGVLFVLEQQPIEFFYKN